MNDINSTKYLSFTKDQFNQLITFLKSNKTIVEDTNLFEFLENDIPKKLRDCYKIEAKIESLINIISSSKTNEIITREKKYTEYLYFLYYPLVEYINHQKKRNGNKPLVFGIFGHQGTGKTTLSNILQELLRSLYNYEVNFLSIDDIYKTYTELELTKEKEPAYKYRGPPGTHDIELGVDVMTRFKNFEINYSLPRYDKSMNNGLGDRSNSLSVKVEKPLDILIFEGWFLGINPVTEQEIEDYSKKDISPKFFNIDLIRKMNEKLVDYKRLWEFIDIMLILRPEQFELSRKWRIQAEEEMIRRTGKGLNSEKINEFIDFFWECLPPYLFFEGSKNVKADFEVYLDEERNFRYKY